jgi:hypothetical protein
MVIHEIELKLSLALCVERNYVSFLVDWCRLMMVESKVDDEGLWWLNGSVMVVKEIVVVV